MKRFLLPLVAGLAGAAALTASPLTVVALPFAWLLIRAAGRGLADDERRALTAVLWLAFGARLAAITVIFLIGLPGHSDASVGGLSGDDAYYFSRAIRARDLILGFAAGKYDYFVVNDAYGQTSYLRLLTAVQVVAGPTPYGMRVVNALMFVTGSTLLFRTVRSGVGRVPAFVGLVAMLFLPSLFFWSISLLKESMFFMVTAVLITATMTVWRGTRPLKTALLVVLAAACLWLLDDLRRGGLVLATAGVILGVSARMILARRWAIAIAVAAAVLAVLIAFTSDSIRERVVGGITNAAQIHMGHVFTVGHAYKLLDEGFYKESSLSEPLTIDQAGRFLARAVASFVLTPLPWEIRSGGELALWPEHLLWYVILALIPVGFVAMWGRDPKLACLLLGLALPTAITLAMTNGNVGTLLRLRALVTPQLIWISAVGFVAIIASLVDRSRLAASGILRPQRQTR